MKQHEQNKESKKLFSDITIIDWYDGATLAIAKRIDSSKWYLASAVYINFENGCRIFQLIEVEEPWVRRMQNDIQPANYDSIKRKIKNKFLQYNSDLFLAKGQDLDASDLELRKISIDNLRYYADIEEISDQEKLAAKKWMAFFE